MTNKRIFAWLVRVHTRFYGTGTVMERIVRPNTGECPGPSEYVRGSTLAEKTVKPNNDEIPLCVRNKTSNGKPGRRLGRVMMKCG